MKKILRTLFITVLMTSITSSGWGNDLRWAAWVEGVRVEALAQGIRPDLFDQIFSEIPAPNPRIWHYDHHQPEKRLTFLQYRNTRVDAYRIQMGQQAFAQNEGLLKSIGKQYGVDPCFIVALWGLETSYGKFVGTFPVIPSLATLAYDSPRAHFFRKELLYALHIVNDGQRDYKNFKGEWAGASGQPQFLPSSWQRYAVDYDGDGRKDIWTTLPDVFASIANYLAQNGWQNHQPWGIEVKIPPALDITKTSLRKTIADWNQLGVTAVYPQQWPADPQQSATWIHPDGGPDFLIFPNFNVIMKWNHSIYYAGSVGYAADRICKRGPA